MREFIKNLINQWFSIDKVLGFSTVCFQTVKYEKDHISIITIAKYLTVSHI